MKSLNEHDINVSDYDEIEIESIEYSFCDQKLVDIEVENDHLYHVSQDNSQFVITHNTSWPDIDSDAGDRDELIRAAQELFGNDAVIPVSNFNTLKLKSLVKDASKFFDVPFEEVNAITNTLQEEVMPLARDEDQEKSVFVLKHDDCMKYSPGYRAFMEKYPDVERNINALFMENRSIGRHAGGVLVADPVTLEKTMPIIAARGEIQTPWTEGMNFRNLEDNGFLKFDFLGLTLLKDVENCIRRILITQGTKQPKFADIKEFFDKNLNCRFVKQDDQKVWKHVYHEGRFTSVFQFTADGARKFCLEAKPDSIDELAALTAIYRPGPLKANVHKLYVEAKKNAKNIKYAHPIIEEILGSTFGYVVFQEQFMELARRLAGFSPGESDQLRKTLVKKSLDTLGKKMGEKDEARQKFVEGALKLNGVPKSVTEPLWETIEAFSVYGFNRSHSIAYAIDSYYAAWLHTYYEKEWLATVLQSVTGNPKELAKAITEIKQQGYKLSQVDINYSGEEWTWSNELSAFVPPLTSVKGVGSAAVAEILANRPYKDIYDMLYDNEGEWRHSKMNRSCFESLCLVEGFGSLSDIKNGTIKNHKILHDIIIGHYDELKKGPSGLTKTQTKKWVKEHGVVRDLIDELTKELFNEQDWTRAEKLSNAYEILSGVNEDIVFPLHIMKKIENANVQKISEIIAGEKSICWFCIQSLEKKQTKNGKTFLTITAIDDTNASAKLRVWGQFKSDPEPFTIWLAEVDKDPAWGCSTNAAKMKKVEI